MSQTKPIIPTAGDALLVVDVQNDFVPGGSLAVRNGDRVLAPLNHCIEVFTKRRLPAFLTRDWHPLDHCSFFAQGGSWPPHCVAGTSGAEFAAGVHCPGHAVVVSKGTSVDQEAYSGFAGTDLAARLREAGVSRLFVGGLATDYCVLRTVEDALALGFAVVVLRDGVAAVDVHAGDGRRALEHMRAAGASIVDSDAIEATARHHHEA